MVSEIFLGESGLRAGWRLLIFLAVPISCLLGFREVVVHIPTIARIGEETILGIDIRDPFAHEAAHALVYDALDIPVAQVWVQRDIAGREWGMAERGADV